MTVTFIWSLALFFCIALGLCVLAITHPEILSRFLPEGKHRKNYDF